MLSIGKILMLAGVVLAVMVVWRWLKAREGVDGRPAANRRRRKPDALTQDMEPCPSCGTFIAVGSGSCGRSECPASGSRS